MMRLPPGSLDHRPGERGCAGCSVIRRVGSSDAASPVSAFTRLIFLHLANDSRREGNNMTSARNEPLLARIKNEQLREAAGKCLEIAELFHASRAAIERSDHFTQRGREQARLFREYFSGWSGWLLYYHATVLFARTL